MKTIRVYRGNPGGPGTRYINLYIELTQDETTLPAETVNPVLLQLTGEQLLSLRDDVAVAIAETPA